MLFKEKKKYLEFGKPQKFDIKEGINDSQWGKPKLDKIDDDLFQLSLFQGDFN